jgi:uncharacterized protein YkwD
MRTVASLTLVLSSLLAALFAAPGPAAAAAGTARMDGTERQILRAINRQRSSHGLGRIGASRRLARAADFHSSQMLTHDFFAHDSPNGSPFDRRVRRFARHRHVGETLAMLGGGCGRGRARRFVRMWMNSPGHRAILLSSGFGRAGIGKRVGSLGSGRACVVTADFGG